MTTLPHEIITTDQLHMKRLKDKNSFTYTYIVLISLSAIKYYNNVIH